MMNRTASAFALDVMAVPAAPSELDARFTHANRVSGSADPFVTRPGENCNFLRTTSGDIRIVRPATLPAIGSGRESRVLTRP